MSELLPTNIDCLIDGATLRAAVWYERELIAAFHGGTGKWVMDDGSIADQLTDVEGELRLGTTHELSTIYKDITDEWLESGTTIGIAVTQTMIYLWRELDLRQLIGGVRS